MNGGCVCPGRLGNDWARAGLQSHVKINCKCMHK